jgi:hypothetical protein
MEELKLYKNTLLASLAFYFNIKISPINRGKLGHSKTFLKHIKKDRGYY